MLNRSDKYNYKIAQFVHDMPKPKKGEIVIIPEDNRLIETPPFVAGSKLPSWWKNLPKTKGSLRFCEGTYDFNNLGIIVPMWTNITIRPDIQGKDFETKISPMDHYAGNEGNFAVQGFTAHSASGCPMENIKKIKTGRYIKLVSPWRYRTPKGVSLMAMPILHEPNPDYEIVPGLIHTDFYNQIHIVLNIKTDKEFVITAGTPLQQLIPISRRDNTRKIIFGNESMYKYVKNSGLGENNIPTEIPRIFYRKKQKELDLEVEEKKKWFFLKK